MIKIESDAFPPFLEEEFERMNIPGGDGFSISYSSGTRRVCVSCGLVGGTPLAVRYVGEEYTFDFRRTIPLAAFEQVCDAIPIEVRKSGVIGAEDIIDGETYLVKILSRDGLTRLVLANPRAVGQDRFKQVACQLDDLMSQAVAEPFLSGPAQKPGVVVR